MALNSSAATRLLPIQITGMAALAACLIALIGLHLFGQTALLTPVDPQFLNVMRLAAVLLAIALVGMVSLPTAMQRFLLPGVLMEMSIFSLVAAVPMVSLFNELAELGSGPIKPLAEIAIG